MRILGAKERIPTLEEVLELITPYQIELNIELKTNIFPFILLLYSGFYWNEKEMID